MWSLKVLPITSKDVDTLCEICGANRPLLRVEFVHMGESYNQFKGVRCGSCLSSIVADVSEILGHTAEVESEPRSRIALMPTGGQRMENS